MSPLYLFLVCGGSVMLGLFVAVLIDAFLEQVLRFIFRATKHKKK